MLNDLSPAPNTNPAQPVKEAGLSAWTQRPWLKTEPLLRVLLVLLIILVSVWLATITWQVVSFFSSLILLFAASWMVALLLTNPVRWFVRAGWPKMAAISAAYVILLGVIAGFVVLVLPGLIAQTTSLSTNLGGLTGELERNLNLTLKGFGVNSLNLDQASSQLQNLGADLLKNALSLATGVANFLIQILLLLIISFSLLAGREFHSGPTGPTKTPQADNLKPPNQKFWMRLPQGWRRRADFVRLSFERNFGVFLGGQLVVAAVYGCVTGVIMGIAGFEYPVTTACICGVLMIIPFFGGPLSLLPPLIVAFSRNDSPIVIVLILLFIIQTALLNVVLPKLVGKSSGVGPVTTLFVLLAGAQVGGVFGVLLAVPVTGVAKSLAISLVNEFLSRDEAPAPVTVSINAPAATKVELDVATLVAGERP